MAEVEVLARNVRGWAGTWSDDATAEIIDHVSDLADAAGNDLAFLAGVHPLLAAPWRMWKVEIQVQNGGYYQYFWNGYAPIAAASAEDFDAVGAPGLAVVQRSAVAAYNAAASQLAEIHRRPDSPDGQRGPYQDGLAVEDFRTQDEAWGYEVDRYPVLTIIGSWCAQRPDAVADAVLATRHLPGAS